MEEVHRIVKEYGLAEHVSEVQGEPQNAVIHLKRLQNEKMKESLARKSIHGSYWNLTLSEEVDTNGCHT